MRETLYRERGLIKSFRSRENDYRVRCFSLSFFFTEGARDLNPSKSMISLLFFFSSSNVTNSKIEFATGNHDEIVMYREISNFLIYQNFTIEKRSVPSSSPSEKRKGWNRFLGTGRILSARKERRPGSGSLTTVRSIIIKERSFFPRGLCTGKRGGGGIPLALSSARKLSVPESSYISPSSGNYLPRGVSPR